MNKFICGALLTLSIGTIGLTGCGNELSGGTTMPTEQYAREYYSNVLYPKTKNGNKYSTETPDPSIVKGDDGYFYVFTTGNGGGKCFRSKDGVNFVEHLTTVIPRPTWGDDLHPSLQRPSVWAPDCAKIKDKWIYYYSLSGMGNPIGVGYAVADNIAGPYEDKGKLFTCEEIGLNNAIDQCLFFEDGHIYMMAGSFQGVVLFELTSDGMGLLGGADYVKKNKILISGMYGPFDYSTYEGSYVFKKDDYYYYLGSMGSCCIGKDSTYRVVVARSKSIKGPYIDKQNRCLANSGGKGTMFVQTKANNKKLVAPGHGSVMLDEAGDYWFYYHAYTSEDNYATRHLMLDKINFDDEGWPYIGKINDKQPTYREELEGPAYILGEEE